MPQPRMGRKPHMNLSTTLSGTTVIEVAAYIPGPVCTQILAGLGATVVKVERPGGDPMRHMPPLGPDGQNPQFALMNAGKTCVELDLKAEDGAAELRRMAAAADVIVDGLRPGALDRSGLGATALRTINPRLIYCAISGYGLSGPDSTRAGHDLNFVALSGFLAMTGVGGTPALPGAQLADMTSGLSGATAILAALQLREKTGLGGVIDLPMHGAMRWLMAPWMATARAGVSIDAIGGTLTGDQACYRLYRTADGRHLAVAALEPHFWSRFCAAIDRPDLVAAQYNQPAQPALSAAVAAIIAEHPLAHWQAHFADIDACVTPVLRVEEAAERGAVGVGLPIA